MNSLSREELEEQLENIKKRLQVLDMIDERLFEMKLLAQRVIDEELDEKKIDQINNKVQDLEQQVKLLEMESTDLS